MSTDRVMLLIDADNVSVDVMEQAVRLLMNQHGAVHVRRAYCTAESAVANQAVFKRLGIKPMVNLAAGKNSTDIAMAVDAIDLVLAERPDVVAVCSSDSDFAPLVQRLREKGCVVRGIGQMGKVGDETQDVYDDYTVLEHRKPSPGEAARAASAAAPKRTRAPRKSAAAPAAGAKAAGARSAAGAKASTARKAAPARKAPATKAGPPVRAAVDAEPSGPDLPTAMAPALPQPVPQAVPEAVSDAVSVAGPAAAVPAAPVPAAAKPAARKATPRKTASRKAAATAAESSAPVAVPPVSEAPSAVPAPVAAPVVAPTSEAVVAAATAAASAPRGRNERSTTLQTVLACLPELQAGKALALNVAVQRLREAQLLGKNSSSLKLFSQLSDRFELLPADKPSQVRLRA